MLPDAYNPPAITPQFIIDLAIAFPVGTDLLFPETLTRSWHYKMLRTLMPKAAVNKYDNSSAMDNEIGSPRKPILNAVTHT